MPTKKQLDAELRDTQARLWKAEAKVKEQEGGGL